jgi:hypothetical protein
MEALQKICLDELMKEITVSTIFQELYSEYSHKYQDVFTRQKAFLLSNFVSLASMTRIDANVLMHVLSRTKSNSLRSLEIDC